MTATFLDRNKKKGLLAALLLFIRERKVLVLLLLLVLIASTVFLGPSSLITGLPGGARVAAGVAWIAGRMGMDVSKWGLAPGGRASYGDLVAAFRAAKANADGGAAVGWGAFFGRGGAAAGSGAAGSGQDSLGMVRGSKADLEGGATGGDKLGGGKSVKGILNPEDASADKDAQGVALKEDDLGGEREGFAKSAFAGGFTNGLLGGAGGESALSGGAFAGRGFFNGKGGAASARGLDLAKSGLDGIPQAAATRSKIQGAAKGSLSAMRAHAVDVRGAAGTSKASLNGGNRAFYQLAQGRGRAAISTTPNCTPPGCPGEYAATNTGAIYDGNSVGPENTAILTAPEVDGVQSPDIPDSGLAQGYEDQANKMDADAQKCKDLDAKYGPQEDALNSQMTAISDQFKSADCGGGGCSKSKARHCQALGDQLKAKCNEYMNVRCEHTHACPLTASQNCSNECSGATGQRAQSTTVHSNSADDGPSHTTVPQ